MCGICGFVSKREVSLSDLKAMNDNIIHRGPDDHGEELYSGRNGYCIGLAQRRLSILDLSELGHQPMHSKDGRLTVVYNGEIYNFRELKERLSGYPFISECDTEVILAAYEKWGKNCVNQFNGMFAIGLYDRETNELFLARDRIGKKPLYYWMDTEKKSIVFASELKAIMCCPGLKKDLNPSVISRYLYQQYINAPETILNNVYKLEPGSILTFHEGELLVEKYWDVMGIYDENQGKIISDYEEAKDGLKKILREAVRLRMVADVPVGALLSGGYDSSLVTAIAQEISGSKPVRTFSIGFNEKTLNEAQYAKKVSDYLGTSHTELYCTEKELFELLEDVPYYFDEPFADPSLIPTMAVSRLARESVTVSLSGDGGDEFFCGYGYYEQVRIAQKLDLIGAIVHSAGRLTHLEDKLPLAVKIISQNRKPYFKTQLRSDTYRDCVENMLPNQEKLDVKYSEEHYVKIRNWQVRRMLLDMDSYLSGGILTKVDRASMRYSLECRCPILDKNVMEYSFRLPHAFKYDNRNGKKILKDITHDYISQEIMDRPKMGFNIPLDQWMRGVLKEKIRAYADVDYLKKQAVFEPDYCNRIINFYLSNGNVGNNSGKNYQNICWNFFLFQLWYERWIK